MRDKLRELGKENLARWLKSGLVLLLLSSVALNCPEDDDDDDPESSPVVTDELGVTLSKTAVALAANGMDTYTVALDAAPNGDVTITPASSNESIATVEPVALTFTTANWATAQTVTVRGVAEGTATIGHTITGGGYDDVTIANVTATVEAAGTAIEGVSLSATTASAYVEETTTYMVVLDTAPSDTVTITVTSDQEGIATDIAVLTFTTENWDVPQTVTVTGVAAGVATISHSATGGGYDSVVIETFTVTVAAVPGVTLSTTAVALAADGYDTYTIALDAAPSDTVTITPASSDESIATVGGALIFTTADWNMPQTVTVTGAAAGTATVSHAISGGGYGNVTIADVTATVEAAGTEIMGVTLSETAVSATVGSAATYTVALDTAPSGDVTITPVSSDTAIATVSGALTFTTANWDTAQTVTVTGAAIGTATIGHSASGGGYNSVTIESVTATVAAAPDSFPPPTADRAIDFEDGCPTSDPNEADTITPFGGSAVACEDIPASATSANMATGKVLAVAEVANPDWAGITINLSETLDLTNACGFTADVHTPDAASGVDLRFELEDSTSVSGCCPTNRADLEGVSTTAAAASAFERLQFDFSTLVRDAQKSQFDRITLRLQDSADSTYYIDNIQLDDSIGDCAFPPGVTLSETALNMDAESAATYTVVLDAPPSGDVTITPVSSDAGIATVSGALTFTAANWDTAQAVTVTGTAEGTATVSHAISGGGYDSVTVADVTAVVTGTADSFPPPTATQAIDFEDGCPTSDPNEADTITPFGGSAVACGDIPASATSANMASGQVLAVAEPADPNWAGITINLSGTLDLTNACGFTADVHTPDAASGVGLQFELEDSTSREGCCPTNRADIIGVGTTAAAASAFERLLFDFSALVTDAQRTQFDLITLRLQDSADSTYYIDNIQLTNDCTPPPGVTVGQTALNVGAGGVATYTVALDVAPSDDVTITPASGDTGIATVSGALTFTTTNWDTAQTVTVTGVADGTATVSHTISGGGYDGVTVADVTAVVTSAPDSFPPPTADQAIDFEEGCPTSDPNEADTITPFGGSALACEDIPASAATLGMATGQVLRVAEPADPDWAGITINLSGTLDLTNSCSFTADVHTPGAASGVGLRFELEDSTSVSGCCPTNRADIVGVSTTAAAATAFERLQFDFNALVTDAQRTQFDRITLRLQDSADSTYYIDNIQLDDSCDPGVSLSATTVNATVGGAAATYTIALDVAPSGDVTITPTSGDTGIATVEPASLTFTAANWNIAQTVTVTGVAAGTATVSHSISGGGYDGVTVADVTASVTQPLLLPLGFDSDSACPSFAIEAFGGAEVNCVGSSGISSGSEDLGAGVLRIAEDTGDASWAGISIQLADNLDLSTNCGFTMFVNGEASTDTMLPILFKLEDKLENPGEGLAYETPVTPTAGFGTLSFDFSTVIPAANAQRFDRIVLFIDVTMAHDATYYFDNIKIDPNIGACEG